LEKRLPDIVDAILCGDLQDFLAPHITAIPDAQALLFASRLDIGHKLLNQILSLSRSLLGNPSNSNEFYHEL